MILYLYFYHQLWVCIHKSVYIRIGNSSGHIGQTHSRFPQNICECLTLNKMHINLTSLKICLINDNLNNTSSTPPQKKSSAVYSAFDTFEYINRNSHLFEI